MTYLLSLAVLALAIGTAAHAVLYKRDTRAVIAWVTLIIVVPLAGAVSYWLLGVNRVRRKAIALRPRPAGGGPGTRAASVPVPAALVPLARLGDRISPFAVVAGNGIEPLDGEAAFPRMLDAIAQAKRTVALSTYIFDDDSAGLAFADALVAARSRGVEVRVLIDAVGQRYSLRSMVAHLRDRGVPAAAFLPVRLPRDLAVFNLRNHRKLLVVDGSEAFIGGMNIREGIRDLQFRVGGPVVAQLQRVFADDWSFTTQERLGGDAWFPALTSVADGSPARAVPDGPDEHFEALRLLLLGAIGEARRSVSIVTPYFLPDQSLVSALNTAAMRGVAVDIILPERSNLKLVEWASHATYWQVLQRGCRIWHSPPPFDHSKLLLVDDGWALIGSTNWDPRSLRLNFELNVECFDRALMARLQAWFEQRRDASAEITLEQMNARPLPVRLRDGVARLLTPYL